MTPSFRKNRIVKRSVEYGNVCSEIAVGHREMPKGLRRARLISSLPVMMKNQKGP